MKKKYILNIIIYKFLLIIFICHVNIKEVYGQVDSVDYFIRNSKNKNILKKEKLGSLNKAYSLIKGSKEDKIKCKYLSEISFRYSEIGDSLYFEKVNKESLDLALKLKDTFYLADCHWNYADFYIRKLDYEKSFFHYHKAFEYFNSLDNKYETGRMLMSMSFIKAKYKDFQASEVLVFEAIKKFKETNDNYYLYRSYNRLGALQEDIKEYDKAIFYFNRSLEYYEESINRKYLSTYNNIANIYLHKKKYRKALDFYDKDLLIRKSISRKKYARIINNKARCKLLMNDTLGIKEVLFEALKIRDSLGYKLGIVSSKKAISDYYRYLKDTTSALRYAKEANSLARQIKNGGDYLTTLKQLADLDIKNSKKYLDRYIVFNDSLVSEERRARNRFTRIEFETEEHIQEAEKLSQQNLLITISSIATILVLSLLYFIRVQKAKNEKLRLEADEQKANEEVYVLTLQQQAKLEEERVNERNRISAELHDGILGKLFGTRVNLGFLAMQMNTDTQEKHQAYMEELQVIEKEIREVSHKLSDNFDESTINFATIINQLLKDKSELGKFKYQFNQDKNISWVTINEVTKANIYRIIQEALQNIIKHAKAKNVILDFSKEEKLIKIVLKDDGVGFNIKKKKTGIGVKNIKARVEKLKGTIILESQINKGTKITINLPIN